MRACRRHYGGNSQNSRHSSAFGVFSSHRITEVKTAPHSPWQNGHIERVIGSIPTRVSRLHNRRQGASLAPGTFGVCRLLPARTHLSLEKDCPLSRPCSGARTAKLWRSRKSVVCIIATNASLPDRGSSPSTDHPEVLFSGLRTESEVRSLCSTSAPASSRHLAFSEQTLQPCQQCVQIGFSVGTPVEPGSKTRVLDELEQLRAEVPVTHRIATVREDATFPPAIPILAGCIINTSLTGSSPEIGFSLSTGPRKRRASCM